MKKTTERYFVRFAVHTKDVYRANFLAELAEDTGVTIREVPDGRIEITDFHPAKTGGWVRHALSKNRIAVGSLSWVQLTLQFSESVDEVIDLLEPDL